MSEARAFAYRERAAQAHDKAKRANISEETSFVQSLVKDAPPTAHQHTERSPTRADKRTAIHLPSGGLGSIHGFIAPLRILVKSAHY
jgi:hypothetical protein